MSTRGRKPYTRPPPPESADGQWVHDLAPNADQVRKPRPNTSNVTSESARLNVSNLHYEVTQKDLASIFGAIGTLVREPTIRYDRSGRSTGVATVQFVNARDAVAAQKQLDGALAKGEVMNIKLDTAPPPRSRAADGRTSTSTLLNRMDKKPLADRLADSEPSKTAGDRSGPVRNAKPKAKPTGKQASGKPARVKSAPKTAEELDQELEAFMGEGEDSAPKDKEEDVAMV
ncbi:RNA recognition motif protein [Ceratobasidium sp. AG-Ba]|nr:RNA recognition motif protein [Ceratobasidium sp. AG-Ba]